MISNFLQFPLPDIFHKDEKANSGKEEIIKIMEDALKSISRNSCCDNCQEAALVAKHALSRIGVDTR